MIQHSPIMKQEKNYRVYFFTMAYNILRIMELLIYFKDGMKILVRCNKALEGESSMNKSFITHFQTGGYSINLIHRSPYQSYLDVGDNTSAQQEST